MKKIRIALYYVLSVYLLTLLFMSAQRIILLTSNWQYLEGEAAPVAWILSAMIRGVWFDNVIACGLSLLPLLTLSIAGLFNWVNKGLLVFFNVFYLLLFIPVLGIGMANVPYFQYFFRHLNSSILNWSEEGVTAVGMIFGEASYYIYMLFFLVFAFSFGYLLFRLSNRLLSRRPQNTTILRRLACIPLCLALVGLCLFGIRGRTGYNPIRTSQAYFCSNSFLNQLGINPTFYFVRDIVDSSKSYHKVDEIISEKDAFSVVQYTFQPNTERKEIYPSCRNVVAEGEARNMNVVVILMESMSAELLKVRQNGREITPFLNELIERSYYFDNFYSSGTHTNHGILATLYGLPSLFARNTMKNVNIPLCQGLPNILQEQGYRTLFFVTHEAQYDNMNAFLLENGIDEMYAEEDYPREMRRNSFGVADDFLFDYALEKLREKARQPEPFMATILTISNHPPYVVPERFKAISDDPQFQIVAFADDALRQFMTKASREDWYENTLFVLLGDHGKMVGTQTYDMPLSYHHIPLILYSPAFEDAPRRFSNLGGQIDVFPTVMGLLNRSYVNNTFGVDLLGEPRPYIFFSSDDALGCLDQENFYTFNLKVKMEGLYRYRDGNPENLIGRYGAKADSMRVYSSAMLRAADCLLKNRLTRVVDKSDI